jgi:carbonic anhydrase
MTGHYHCGGVKASLGTTQFGLIDNWLRTIKDVYRGMFFTSCDIKSNHAKHSTPLRHSEHQSELDAIEDQKGRERRLVELNVVNSAMNVASTTIVQNAWHKGQTLAVHGWAHNIEDG